MERPTSRSHAVLNAAAEELAADVARWCEETVTPSLIKQIEQTLRSGETDGYRLAREFERFALVDGNEELVEIFSGAYMTVHNHLENAEKYWVAVTKWAPEFLFGDAVTCRHGTGTIAMIDSEHAKYGVCVPPQTDGYWILSAHEVRPAEQAKTMSPSP